MNYSKHVKGIFLAIMLLVIAAICTSIQVSNVQSAMRAFIDEEGNWAKSHRDAFEDFITYQYTDNTEYYNAFIQHLKFNKGIKEVKELLDNKQYTQAKTVFIDIGAHSNNVDKVIYLYKYFFWLEKSQQAFKIWDEANNMIMSLELLAAEYRSAESPEFKKQLLNEIQSTRHSMLQAEKDFENTFVDLAIQSDHTFTLLTVIIFSSLGLIIFIIIRKALNKITEKDELYQATFNKTQLAYVQFKLNGDLIEANQQFLDLIKCEEQIFKELNFFRILKNQGNPGHLISVQKNNKHQDFQFKLGAKNNQDNYYKAHTTLIHNYSGTPLYFVAAINDISQEQAQKQALKKLAHNDYLTGLMNKFAFENLLSTAVKNKSYGYLLYMDLNGFKVVNDQAGHSVGDKILEQVTKKIHAQLRSDDPLARMGGDEFALFLENITLKRAIEIAKNIRHKLSAEPFTFEMNRFNISISIGISRLSEQPTNIEDLINQADEACYLSKAQNQVIVHQDLAQSA